MSYAWLNRYLDVVEIAKAKVESADAELIACGLTCNVDLVATLDSETFARLAVGRSIDFNGPRQVRGDTPDQLLTGIAQHIKLGEGFDFPVANPETQSWLIENIESRTQLGGSGAQTANTLAVLGFGVLAHLTGCSPEQAAAFDRPDNLLVPRDGLLVRVDEAADPSNPTMFHVALEYPAGLEIAAGDRTITAPSESRIIVSYDPVNCAFRIDESFVQAVTNNINSIPKISIAAYSQITEPDALQLLIADSIAAFRRWKAARPEVFIHVELGAMSEAGNLVDLVAALGPEVDSIGMNADEFRDLNRDLCLRLPFGPIERLTALSAIRNYVSTPRICVHSAGYAMTLTSGDPEHERTALLFAALVASTRARTGRFPTFADLDETLADGNSNPAGIKALIDLNAPDGVIRQGADSIVIVPTIEVPTPAATVGLGDSFTAGAIELL